VTFDDRRTLGLFERYGFKVLNRSRISKFERFTSKPVYLTTIIKDVVEKGDRVFYQVAPHSRERPRGSESPPQES
jgi:hypothetical protein